MLMAGSKTLLLDMLASPLLFTGGRYDGSVATPSSQELHQKIPAPPVAAAVPGAVPAAAPPVAPGPASPERKPKASPSRSSSAKRVWSSAVQSGVGF